jgi:hypothetical protein
VEGYCYSVKQCKMRFSIFTIFGGGGGASWLKAVTWTVYTILKTIDSQKRQSKSKLISQAHFIKCQKCKCLATCSSFFIVASTGLCLEFRNSNIEEHTYRL